MTDSTSALTLSVPAGQTAAARALLEPYLIHEAPWNAIGTEPGERRRLTLHPRVASPGALPEALRRDCAVLDGSWGERELGSLSPAEHTRLFTVVFFSKSRPGPALAPGLPTTWRRLLSNFHPAVISVDDAAYASVEHYFQAQKARCSTRPEMAEWFTLGSTASETVGPDPSAAKRAGGRKAFTAADATLDADAWLEQRVPVMQRALGARWDQQPEFRAVLSSTEGLDLLHFERSGARSFWGGSLSRATGLPQGQNELGRMLMAIRNRALLSLA